MTSNLTKRKIVKIIHEKTGFPQDEVQATVQMTLDTIANSIGKGQKVELRNFGIFGIQIRKARVGRNPKKPEKDVQIPERAVVKFRLGKRLKDKLKQLSLGNLGGNTAEEEAPKPQKTGFTEKLKTKLKELEDLDF